MPATSVQGITLDTDLPKTPEYKFTVSPQWDVHLANTGKLRFAVDYTQDGLDVQRCAEHAAARAPGHRQPGRVDPLLLARREVRR